MQSRLERLRRRLAGAGGIRSMGLRSLPELRLVGLSIANMCLLENVAKRLLLLGRDGSG